MKPETWFDRLRRHIIWGQWSWRTMLWRRRTDDYLLVIGKAKVIIPRRRR